MSELKCCPFCGGEARLYGNSKPIGIRLKHYQVAVCTNDDCGCRTSTCETVEDAICRWNTRKPIANIVEKLEEKTEFLEDCTKYGNESAEQQEKSYSTMMMYEVAGLADDLINIVKQEMNNGLE